jgi:hypothetical protein
MLWLGKISETSYVELADVVMWVTLGLFTAVVADKKFNFRKNGEDDATRT